MRISPRAVLFFLLASIIAVPTFAADTVAGLVESFDNPKLASTASVTNYELKSGHIVVKLDSGTVTTLTAGERTIGVFLSGQGSWSYAAADPLELPIVSYKLRKTTNLKSSKTGDGLTITDSFTSARIWLANIDLPPVTPSAAGAPQKEFDDNQEIFRHDWNGPGSFLFVREAIDGTKKPLFRAEFSGGQDKTVYVYDPIDTRSESLYTLRRDRTIANDDLRSYWFPSLISNQMIDRNRRDFAEPPYLLVDLTYTLIADGKDAKLSTAETIIPRGSAQSVFRFAMKSKEHVKDTDTRTFRVRSVTDEQGKAVSFHHERGQLLVGLSSKIPADRPTRLKFEIEGDFLVRPGGDSFWQLGTEAWFPQPELNGQYYTIDSTVKVKKPWVAFAPGKTVARAESGDYNVVRNVIDKPVQFAVVHAGKYAMAEETSDGLTVRIATYAGENDVAMKKLSNLAMKLIRFYEPFLGPFPFSEFNIIEINDFGWGQAPPATMFITKEAFNPLQDEENQAYSKGVNQRFAHEIAHQYWGHVVKMGSDEEQWLTESFAEFCSALAVRQIKGKGGYNAMFATWKANAKVATNIAPIPLANRIPDGRDYTTFMNRTNLVYDKGAYLLGSLDKMLGEDAMLTFLRNYQAMFAWKFGTTKDVEGLLTHIAKKDMKEFFDKNFWGTGMP